MKNEERFIPVYLDCASGTLKSGLITYKELLNNYDGNKQIVDTLWDKGFTIPDDTDIRDFECHIVDERSNRIYYSYTCNFRALKEQKGLVDAIKIWYGIYSRKCAYEYQL